MLGSPDNQLFAVDADYIFFRETRMLTKSDTRRMQLSASCLRAKNDLTKVTLEDMTFCVNF
jgi:hypothetical protein